MLRHLSWKTFDLEDPLQKLTTMWLSYIDSKLSNFWRKFTSKIFVSATRSK